MTVDSMKFKRRPLPRVKAEELVPRLTIKLPRDVENKKDWGKGKALKDALSDAFSAAWKLAIKTFATTFLDIFKEEIEEYIDWNPDDILLKINVPIRGLRWITLKKIKLADLKQWVDDE